ncbi:MAG: 2-phosphotransferase [Bacteroidota bacterium]|jgi:putative RNA 2'-phosphotransferase
MNKNDIKQNSKFLSLVLRHAPETIGLTLDENGWANVDELINLCNSNNQSIDRDLLELIVKNNDKQRFSFKEDGSKIRANQGHSIEVDLCLKEVTPPEKLYHGTVNEFLDAIKSEGLKKMSRQHVHLSKDLETAIKVGSRRGKPIILEVNAMRMNNDGFKFYLSENNVWLTDVVPSKYINFPDE